MKILLETQRLILREFIDDDSRLLFKLHNDPAVMKYIPHKKPLDVPMERCEKFITHFISEYNKKPGYGLFATILKETNEFIGWSEINHLDNTEEVEIGYRYLKEFWGMGYATEAARALVEYGFNILNLDKLVGVAMADNKASTRVLEKAGMEYLEIRQYYDTDVAYYEIFKSDL